MSGSKSRSGSASKGGDGRRSFAESLDNRRKAYKVLHRVAYPRSITMGLQDYDAYKVATEAVFGSLLNVAQSNPAYRVSSGSGLRLTPPDGQEPIRALHDALKKNIFSVEASTETWKGLKAQLDEHDEILERLFKEQHKFYVAGEPMLKKVHFFIYKIVPDFEAARAGMDKSRDNYDAAQNIYDVASDNAKIEALAALKLAGEEFKKQMADVLRLIGIISGLKPAHLKEIEEFVGLFFESDRAMMKSLMVHCAVLKSACFMVVVRGNFPFPQLAVQSSVPREKTIIPRNPPSLADDAFACTERSFSDVIHVFFSTL